MVHPANIQDRDGARLVLSPALVEAYPELALVYADGGYRGAALEAWLLEHVPGVRLERVEHQSGPVWVKPGEPVPPLKKKGFQVLPKRWIVERTFAWLSLNRRLSKDYEATVSSSEAWMWMGMARVLLQRLSRGN